MKEVQRDRVIWARVEREAERAHGGGLGSQRAMWKEVTPQGVRKSTDPSSPGSPGQGGQGVGRTSRQVARPRPG